MINNSPVCDNLLAFNSSKLMRLKGSGASSFETEGEGVETEGGGLETEGEGEGSWTLLFSFSERSSGGRGSIEGKRGGGKLSEG